MKIGKYTDAEFERLSLVTPTKEKDFPIWNSVQNPFLLILSVQQKVVLNLRIKRMGKVLSSKYLSSQGHKHVQLMYTDGESFQE